VNDDRPRRRRRSIDQPASGGRLPLFPLFIVVVLAGLALGAFISQRFNGTSRTPQFAIHTPAATPLITTTPIHRVAIKTPPVKPSRIPLAKPSASAKASPSAMPLTTARATPRPVHRVALTTPKPAKPLVAPVVKSAPTVSPTAVARPIARTAPPAPSSGADAAAGVARDYLSAVMHGDNRTANSALGKSPNSLPDFAEQSFLTPSSQINSVHATANGDGTYKVEAEVASSKGTYFVTFQVSRNVITEHFAIKVQ
jgi:hypothetical protein